MKQSPTDKPNVIFILTDDMGWGDLSCYGHGELKTPNLDRLASQGKLFTQFYVSSGVCSPSRVAFSTGQFPARHGVHGHFSSVEENRKRNMPDWLDPEVPTLYKQLQKAGYATAHFGKWHMSPPGGEGAPEPTEYGFDEALGYLSTGPQLLADQRKDPYFRAKTTEAIVDETIGFIEKNKDKPFFINAWMLLPHTTLNPTPEQMEPFMEYAPKIEGNPHVGSKVIYYATINDIDTQIGRLMDKLEEMGITDNTIVIFTSDNGPEDIMLEHHGAAHSGIGSAGPFRGRKRSLYEGGIRVPLIVRWPAKIPAGEIDNDSVLSATDLLPTLCHLAGVEVPEGKYAPDGENVVDILTSKPRPRKKPLMWEYHYEMIIGHILHKNPIMAIRDNEWKLLMNPDGSRVELYNIPKDPTELNNVAEDHPQTVERLSKALLAWHKEMPKAPVPPRAGTNDYPWPGL